MRLQTISFCLGIASGSLFSLAPALAASHAKEKPVYIYTGDTSTELAPAASSEPKPKAAAPKSQVVSSDGLIRHTVEPGDSLWSISHKYGTTVEAIRELNKLPNNSIEIGQVLQITSSNPPVRRPVGDETTAKPADALKTAAKSSPAPPLTAGPEIKPPPVTPSESVSSAKTAPVPAPTPTTASNSHRDVRPLANAQPPPVGGKGNSKSLARWQQRLIEEAHVLAMKNIHYAGRWTPPGESKAWVMDCSNTSRYLYRTATGVDIGRTASDQYYYLHQKDRAWEVPRDAAEQADLNYLHKNLQVGDLLFWEHTYKPERTPPITHVMVYLGVNEKGEWIMAGSQTAATGQFGKGRRGGPDIYVFDPRKPSGGYRTFLGLRYKKGRFVAIGRPNLGSMASTLASTGSPG